MQLGHVYLVQIQPNGLIIDASGKTPTGYIYDASRLVQVDQLKITPQGIEAIIPGGENVLDIHHIDHPGKKYGDDDLVCVGFTPHYQAMRSRFGEHIVDGIAGENIIIKYSDEIWPEDIKQRLAIENQDTGEMGIFEFNSHASPCIEFTQFCLQDQYNKVSKNIIKENLRFLDNGRRGFLLALKEVHDFITVTPGDRVFALSN